MKLLNSILALSAAAIGAVTMFGADTAKQDKSVPRFTPEMQKWVENFKPMNTDSSGKVVALSPQESLRQLNPAKGYVVELAAHEPMVRQPIDMRFDERGRLWVVQFLQYPFPAGVTIKSYDQYLRAEFDRMPPPPPAPPEFRGIDRVTILEDTDRDGKFDTSKDFLNDLNLASSIALDDEGVWVLQSPYLVFYPDRNRDDVPDGDPEVHLSGFGLEDTHSVATSLHWGPDGWLYGAKGSTTTLDIQGIKLLGQGIWRYDPRSRKFEIFAEGGGNTFSFEFDQYGRAFSGTNAGSTRGLHYVQGATYTKTWPKHGPAINPFIFGYFPYMAHEGDNRRFAQAFILYEGNTLPELHGQIIAGMALTNRVQASEVREDTSTFRTIDRVTLIDSADKVFRPVDLEDGPDGCIYVADWYDPRIGHVNPVDTWDKATGRIYRIAPPGFVQPAASDLRQLSTNQLIALLSQPNRWKREQARRLLAKRPDALAAKLKDIIEHDRGIAALEALWILNLRGEFSDREAEKYLLHSNEHIRRWTVRLLGDAKRVSPSLAPALATLARSETNLEVRSQLASTALRLPVEQAFPIVRQLLARDEDTRDKHLPLLVWWAIENKADHARDAVLALASDPAVWRTKMFAEHIGWRLGKRYTADQGRNTYNLKQGAYSTWLTERIPARLNTNLEMCARLLAAAPHPTAADQLVQGMAEGLTGAPVDGAPASLQTEIAKLWRTRPHTASLIVLAARLRQPDALAAAVAKAQEAKVSEADQRQYFELFAATGPSAALPLIARRLRTEKEERRRSELLEVLKGFNDRAAAELLLEVFPRLSIRQRLMVQGMLSEKLEWAVVMLERMADGKFDPGVLTDHSLAALRGHRDARVAPLLARHQEKKKEDPAERVALDLFEKGKVVYSQICAACHQPDGQGHPGLAPSLAASKWVQQSNDIAVRIVLHGKESQKRGLVMPSLQFLPDEQIAAALTYVLREFGNKSEPILPATVAALRTATAARVQPWSDEELARLGK